MTRRFVFFPALAVAVAIFAVAAGAAWLAAGTGTSSSRSTSLGMPTSVSASATSSTSIQVTWNTPAAPSPAPTNYDVFRYIGGTGTKICSAMSATAPRVCNDSGLSPSTTYGYTVEARLGANWMSGQTTLVSATTNAAPATPNFLVEQVAPGDKVAGQQFQLRVTARTGATITTGYTGNKTLTFSGPGQNAGFAAPTAQVSASFTAGVASNVPVTLHKAETVNLTVTESTRSGSTSVTVAPGAVGLRWTGSTPSCSSGTAIVGNGGTFTSKVSRLDASGNVVTTTGQVNVSLGRSPADAPALSTSALIIADGEWQSGSSVSLTFPNGSPPDTTITASAPGFSPLTCLVKKN